MNLPEGTIVFAHGGLVGRLAHAAKIVFDRDQSPDDIADVLVAAGRPELLAELEHTDEAGCRVVYTPQGNKVRFDAESGVVPKTESPSLEDAIQNAKDKEEGDPQSEPDVDETEPASDETPEDGDIENDVERILHEQLHQTTVKKLRALADDQKIVIPAEVNRKDEIVDYLLVNADREALTKAIASA